MNFKRVKPDIVLWKRVILLLANSSARLSAAAAILTLLVTAMGIWLLYALKLLIDALSKTGAATTNTQDALKLLGMVTFVLVATVLIQTVLNIVRFKQSIRVSEHINQEIHNLAITVDYGFYESPKYFDSLQRARQAGTERPAQIVTNLFQFVRSAVYLVAIFGMMAAIDWRILPTIALAVSAVLAVRLIFTKRLFQWRTVRTQLERRTNYLDWLITSHLHAKELRIGGLGDALKDAFYQLRRNINDQHVKIETQRNWSEFVVSIIGSLVFAGGTLFLVFETMAGRQSVGDLVFFVLLFRRAEASGNEMISSMSSLYDSQLYLRQLFEFLDVESVMVSPAKPVSIPPSLNGGLVFENVSFQYPETNKPILKNVNLSVASGQIVALVGENGSGKTTIVKLMTRLYDPTEGRITLNGRDIRNFDPAEYRRLFSVMFQDYAKYAMSVRDNIQFGDVATEPDNKRMMIAASKSGAESFITGLRNGYDTNLTRMFDDGAEISVGQWQRIALARSLYPESSFIVMDEPSSAMDPQAEFELFEHFREKVNGRGALVISHRLSTVRTADHTYVIHNGKIIEHGSHDELFSLNGRYANLFRLQAQRYYN